MNELMERLARANSAPADEAPGAEEQREAEALLERIVDRPAAGRAAAGTHRSLRRLAPAAAGARRTGDCRRDR